MPDSNTVDSTSFASPAEPAAGGAPAEAGPGPSPAAAALARCVGVDRARFADQHWGRQPLLTPAGAGFDDLLSLDDVDELLSQRGLRTPFLRVAQDGALVPASRYTGSGGLGAEITDQVRDDRILELLADGATLVLQGLHRLWPPLLDFCGTLAGELACAVQANAYLTPAGNRGFATHYDTHDVFVLQVAGHKRWRIHEPVLPDPLERQPWGGRADEVSAEASGEPALDVVLGPGDALYLPRGWLHAADALGELSLHLTLGLRRPTRHTIVEALLALSAEDERLRAGMPLGLDLTESDNLEPELKSTVEALTDWLRRADPEQVAARLRGVLWSTTRPAPVRPIAQTATLAAVQPDMLISRRPGLRWRLRPGPDSVALELTDRTVSFPAYCEPALRAAMSADSLRVGDLPDLETDADRIVLARRLLREAVIVPASSGQGNRRGCGRPLELAQAQGQAPAWGRSEPGAGASPARE